MPASFHTYYPTHLCGWAEDRCKPRYYFHSWPAQITISILRGPAVKVVPGFAAVFSPSAKMRGVIGVEACRHVRRIPPIALEPMCVSGIRVAVQVPATTTPIRARQTRVARGRIRDVVLADVQQIRCGRPEIVRIIVPQKAGALQARLAIPASFRADCL